MSVGVQEDCEYPGLQNAVQEGFASMIRFDASQAIWAGQWSILRPQVGRSSARPLHPLQSGRCLKSTVHHTRPRYPLRSRGNRSNSLVWRSPFQRAQLPVRLHPFVRAANERPAWWPWAAGWASTQRHCLGAWLRQPCQPTAPMICASAARP